MFAPEMSFFFVTAPKWQMLVPILGTVFAILDQKVGVLR